MCENLFHGVPPGKSCYILSIFYSKERTVNNVENYIADTLPLGLLTRPRVCCLPTSNFFLEAQRSMDFSCFFQESLRNILCFLV